MKPNNQDDFKIHKRLVGSLNLLSWAVVLLLLGTIWYSLGAPGFDSFFEKSENIIQVQELKEVKPIDEVKDGIHIATGLAFQDGFELVQQNCLACHSAKLITQNRMSRERWKETIVWMQETQRLWDLGVNEDKILDYLASNYAPQDKGRRANLVIDEWYEIN